MYRDRRRSEPPILPRRYTNATSRTGSLPINERLRVRMHEISIDQRQAVSVMQRTIVDFTQDGQGDWVAQLDCGHLQHVRHAPPFTNRDWVTTLAGRAEKLGSQLNCVRCDRFEMPEQLAPYKRTRVFSEDTIPAGLRREHSTRRGVWAKIVVLEGSLRYTVEALNAQLDLSSDVPGVVIPEVLHQVAPQGTVRFYVEFYGPPAPAT